MKIEKAEIRNCVMVVALLTGGVALAADTGGGDTGSGYSGDGSSTGVVVSSEMRYVRKQIGLGNYRAAIQGLNGLVAQDYRNADAWNLLGFSQRKLGKFKKASRAYKKALKYNPEHKGALSYQGELFISLGDIPAAEQNLAQLEQLCPEGCKQADALRQAITAL